MAEQTLNNRTTKTKEPKYTDINDIPVSDIINAKSTEAEAEAVAESNEIEHDIKKTTIELNQVAALLGSNTSSGLYEITFPSIGKTYQFKQLTVAQQRTLSKNSSAENRAEQLVMRLALLKELCMDKTFNPSDINFAEFVNALITIRNNNFIGDLKFNIKCDNEDCGATSYPFTVNLIEIQENLEVKLNELNKSSKCFEFEINGKKVRFDLSFPKMSNYVALSKYYVKKENQKNADIALFIYPYIQGISIEGMPVNIDSIRDNLVKFKEFIDNTFIGMSFKKFAEAVNDNFSDIADTMFTFDTTCPTCGTTKQMQIDLEDFFDL